MQGSSKDPLWVPYEGSRQGGLCIPMKGKTGSGKSIVSFISLLGNLSHLRFQLHEISWEGMDGDYECLKPWEGSSRARRITDYLIFKKLLCGQRLKEL